MKAIFFEDRKKKNYGTKIPKNIDLQLSIRFGGLDEYSLGKV